MNKYHCYKFIPNEDCVPIKWIYKKYNDEYIRYPTRDEIEYKMTAFQLDTKDSILRKEKILFDFIFGNISTQFDSLNELNSYLESLFLKEDKQEFIKIAERTFEVFNDTPLLNVLRNYIIKVIVQYSDVNNNIENSNLFGKEEVLEMLMNILNVFVINYSEFQLSQINYWIGFIESNMTKFPSEILGIVANILRISLERIEHEERAAIK